MNTNFKTDATAFRFVATVLSVLPNKGKVLIACSLAFLIADVNAQEYTLQDFVNDADALIVARIVSKQASYMEVRTRQLDGRITGGTPIFTTYGVALIEYSGAEKFRNIREFVLPGGVVGLRGSSRTHTPELDVGMELLVSIRYDELNDFYTLRGIPPIGQSGAVFISQDIQGKRVLIPYGSYKSPDFSVDKVSLDKVKNNASSRSEMLNLEESEAIDFDSFWAAVMEVRNEK